MVDFDNVGEHLKLFSSENVSLPICKDEKVVVELEENGRHVYSVCTKSKTIGRKEGRKESKAFVRLPLYLFYSFYLFYLFCLFVFFFVVWVDLTYRKIPRIFVVFGSASGNLKVREEWRGKLFILILM